MEDEAKVESGVGDRGSVGERVQADQRSALAASARSSRLATGVGPLSRERRPIGHRNHAGEMATQMNQSYLVCYFRLFCSRAICFLEGVAEQVSASPITQPGPG